MTSTNDHTPVLLHECMQGLGLKPDGVFVDVTFGGGGHSTEILKTVNKGKLVVFDQDARAIQNLTADERVIPVQQNFRFMRNFLRYHDVLPVDGILADLGVSSHQFDIGERGFSTRFDGPLDMRMNLSSSITAGHIVNTYSENALSNLFKVYGELDHPFKVAKQLVKARTTEAIETTQKLKEVLAPMAERGRENQFFAQVFQALRIEVNQELEVLKEFLKQAMRALRPGGRLVVISYHSLEDRLVKNFMRSGNFEGEVASDVFGNRDVPFELITKKPILPTADELQQNSRSRSARLRIAERTVDNRNTNKK